MSSKSSGLEMFSSERTKSNENSSLGTVEELTDPYSQLPDVACRQNVKVLLHPIAHTEPLAVLVEGFR